MHFELKLVPDPKPSTHVQKSKQKQILCILSCSSQLNIYLNHCSSLWAVVQTDSVRTGLSERDLHQGTCEYDDAAA